MSDASDWQKQFQALSQGWWNAFTPAAASAPHWGQGMAGQGGAWPGSATGWQGAAGSAGMQETLARFGSQLNDYLGLMRGVAEQAAQGAAPDALAQAWREALAGVSGANPMLAALSSLHGGGARGMHELSAAAEAWLAPMQSQALGLLGIPPVGQLREHQQRLQQLARDQAELQQAGMRYAALLQEASERAFGVFEKKLAERAQPGRQLESARQLYDLWIDAAEESYAEMALTPRFGEAFGALVNAQMKVRQGVQQQVERSAAEFGMPTRRELDSAHRRIVELQRRLAALEARAPASAESGAARDRGAASRDRPRGGRATAAPAGSKSAGGSARTAGKSTAGKRGTTGTARARTGATAAVPRAPAAPRGTAARKPRR